MLWRLAGCPTRISPSSVKATIDGVVRPPSAFSMTLALFPTITATQELVVPRSMPIAFAMIRLLVQRCSFRCLKRRRSAGKSASLRSIFDRTRDAPSARREEQRPTRPATAWGTSSGFLGLGLRGFLDLDFLRLGFGRLRHRDPQDSVRHGCLHA